MPPKRREDTETAKAKAKPRAKVVARIPKATAAVPESVEAQIVASLSSGVLAVDQSGRVLTANAAAAGILNLPADALVPGEDIQRFEAALYFGELARELERGRHGIQRREIEIEVSGVRRILGVTASALRGPAAYNGAIFLFTDLSEVRNLQRRAELNRQLAQIGELTAGVVHELRNPMSVISGMSELILRRLGPDHPQAKQTETIFQEASHIEKLISQFLSFARPFEAKLARCQADPVVDRALQLVDRVAGEKDVALGRVIEPGLPHVQADQMKLAQALGNLLRNAIEAVRPGGSVTLVVQAGEASIDFRVEDDGPGIHLQEGEDLLNPFFSKKEGGTGLGLNIVHRIVTAHGGNITYGNRPEGGAFFQVSLPIEYGG